MDHLSLQKTCLRWDDLFDKISDYMGADQCDNEYKYNSGDCTPQTDNALGLMTSTAVDSTGISPNMTQSSAASVIPASETCGPGAGARVCTPSPAPFGLNKADNWPVQSGQSSSSDMNPMRDEGGSLLSSEYSSSLSAAACVSPYSTVMHTPVNPCQSVFTASEGQLSPCGVSLQEPAEALRASKRDRPASPCPEQAKKVRSDLPPCRICSGRASGFHYGVNTCEACKGFYRRTLSKIKKGEFSQLTCSNQTKACEISKDKKQMCPFCRFEKCKKVGMSKDAIKTGRYTHAKRTRDTLEVQRLNEGSASCSRDEDVQELGKSRDTVKAVVLNDTDDTLRISRLLCGGSDSQQDFQAVIAHVVRAHDQYVYTGEQSYPGCIERKQEEKLAQLRVASRCPALNAEQQTSSVNNHCNSSEGPGPNGDRNKIMQFHVNNSERWIRGYTCFAKEVPGFSALPTEDQQHLAKHGRIEFWYLGAFAGYSTQKNVAVMPNGRCFTKDEMYSVWDTKYVDVSFHLSDILKKLNVMREELILMKAICLTSSDRDRFKMLDPDSADKVQNRLVRCLHWCLDNRFTSDTEKLHTICNIYSAITSLRDLNHAEFKTLKDTTLYKMHFTQSEVIMSYLPY